MPGGRSADRKTDLLNFNYFKEEKRMKFTWKKAAAFAAMAALTVSFAGCGGGDKKADDKKAAPKGNDKELVMRGKE